MAALSAFTTYPNLAILMSDLQSFRVANSVRIYGGALCSLPGTNGLTSSRGYVDLWQDEVNVQWAGIALVQSWTGGLITAAQSGTASNVNSVLGDTSASPVPEVTIEMGPAIIRNLAVTGVSAQSDVWRTLVYCSTDNYSDITTTSTTYAGAIGKVRYWYSSTTCDVELFGALKLTATS